jgi:ubiquinone/menaquinone biosynthesis C-methylase UbiE
MKLFDPSAGNSIEPISKCRICGSTALDKVLDLGNQALTGRFPRPDEPDPLTGPLELAWCRAESGDACGLLQIRHSYPPEQMYGSSYGYRSSNNATMVEHLHNKVTNLIALARPQPGERVLDIGCNDGTTLKFYDGMDLDRIGIDPSSGRFAREFPADIRLIVDFFSAARIRQEVGEGKFKIVTSIAMFYDLEDPLSFMREIASLLAPDGVWEFEQHYLVEMLRRCAYDSVCHEHISYYGLRQIKWMTDRAGLKIIAISTNDINGGSIAIIAAREEAPYPEAKERIAQFLEEEAAMGLHTLQAYLDFAKRVAAHRTALRQFLSRAREAGKLVVGYGASTKGNVILQYCNVTERELPIIAEKYPAKYGLVTPGTRIPIVSEAAAYARKPDYMLVMPWYFRDEIIRRERAYVEGGGTLVFVLPSLEQITKGDLP